MDQKKEKILRNLYTKVRNRLTRQLIHQSVVTLIMKRQIKMGLLPVEFLQFMVKEKVNKNTVRKARGRFAGNSKLKNLIYKKFNGACRKCRGRRGLEIHHIKPIKTHPHLASVESNLTLLCKPCHVRSHARSYPQKNLE